MSVQTSYSIDMAKAIEGQLAESGGRIRSKLAGVAIGYGLFCGLDASDLEKCKLPTSPAEVTDGYGFAAADTALQTQAPPVGYEATDAVSIMARGVMWCKLVGTGCTAESDRVFVRHTGGNEGTIRNDADGGNATELKGARFLDSGSAGDLVRVEFDRQTV